MDIILESDGTRAGTRILEKESGDVLDVDGFKIMGLIKKKTIKAHLNFLWLKHDIENVYIRFKMVRRPERLNQDATENYK